METLAGKVAVITGAASGIGLGLARELGAAGCRLSLADIDAPALEKTADELAAQGFEVLTTVADVGRLEAVEQLAADTLERYGAAHVIVNNAGVIAWNPVDALTIDDWRWVVDVNMWGVIHGVHVFLPILQQQGEPAQIVNVSSTGGVLADVPYMATYSATKAAVVGLSLTLASELRIRNQPIGVTLVCPNATAGTAVHLAERNRPASAGALRHTPEAQQLLDVIGDQITTAGQPLTTMTTRVIEAIRRNDLWVFPNPDSGVLVQPRLDQAGEALRNAAAQPSD
jgi:NAD(P)-dependent dehydrogenase (short-subunit alcohol dehydrogenase family)